MILEQVTLQVGVDAAESFVAAFVDGLHLLQDAHGCRSVELLRSVDTPGQFVLRVGWDSRDDHTERYVGSPPHQQFSTLLGAYITEMVSSDHLNAASLTAPGD